MKKAILLLNFLISFSLSYAQTNPLNRSVRAEVDVTEQPPLYVKSYRTGRRDLEILAEANLKNVALDNVSYKWLAGA